MTEEINPEELSVSQLKPLTAEEYDVLSKHQDKIMRDYKDRQMPTILGLFPGLKKHHRIKPA